MSESISKEVLEKTDLFFMSILEKAMGKETTKAWCMLCCDLTFVVTQNWNLESQQEWTCTYLGVHVSSLSHPWDPNYSVPSHKEHPINNFSTTLQIFYTRSTI